MCLRPGESKFQRASFCFKRNIVDLQCRVSGVQQGDSDVDPHI